MAQQTEEVKDEFNVKQEVKYGDFINVLKQVKKETPSAKLKDKEEDTDDPEEGEGIVGMFDLKERPVITVIRDGRKISSITFTFEVEETSIPLGEGEFGTKEKMVIKVDKVKLSNGNEYDLYVHNEYPGFDGERVFLEISVDPDNPE